MDDFTAPAFTSEGPRGLKRKWNGPVIFTAKRKWINPGRNERESLQVVRPTSLALGSPRGIIDFNNHNFPCGANAGLSRVFFNSQK